VAWRQEGEVSRRKNPQTAKKEAPMAGRSRKKSLLARRQISNSPDAAARIRRNRAPRGGRDGAAKPWNPRNHMLTPKTSHRRALIKDFTAFHLRI